MHYTIIYHRLSLMHISNLTCITILILSHRALYKVCFHLKRQQRGELSTQKCFEKLLLISKCRITDIWDFMEGNFWQTQQVISLIFKK